MNSSSPLGSGHGRGGAFPPVEMTVADSSLGKWVPSENGFSQEPRLRRDDVWTVCVAVGDSADALSTGEEA